MKTRDLTALIACALLFPAAAASHPDLAGQPGQTEPGLLESDWVATASDNICGLRDLEQLSKPAKVNFERCLAATPEMKRMKKEGIRPQSPEGIQLRSEAVDRVTKAANTVREAGGYCSVWKSIKHRDGRRIGDLTSRVIGQY